MKRLPTLLMGAMLLFSAYAMAQGPGGPPGGPGGRGPAGPPPPAPRVMFVHDDEVATKQVSYTIEVMNIIGTKCVGCHRPASRNNNAKRDLQFEKLQDLTGAEARLLLDSINYDVTEKKMPPARTVERNPAAALTPEEATTLKAWVEETLAKIK